MRRFDKLSFQVSTIPQGCVPVRVIDALRYLLVLGQAPDKLGGNRSRQVNNTNSTIYEDQVVGKYQIDDRQMDKLKQLWGTQNLELVAATDGGLKDKVGTSSYALFFPNEFPPILQGFAGEYQPQKSASSTRQELLGQLGLEYWFRRLGAKWGIPNTPIRVALITDSQASIEIINNTYNMIGIKDTLKPDMDIGLEVSHLHGLNRWISRQVIKVESHIEEDKAPNKFNWECNNLVDNLATAARDIFSVDTLRLKPLGVLPGTRACCVVNRQTVNNDLYRKLKNHINGKQLQHFLLNKYGWTGQVFKMIDWDEHDRQLKAFSIQQRVTLTKYIHGWLATQKRRCREGGSSTGLCPLCKKEEDRAHIFECQYAPMKETRNRLWNQLTQTIGCSTEPGFRQIFIAGLSTALGEDMPTNRTKGDWPTELREAYEIQEQIGWEHVFYGRLGRQWESLSKYSQQNHNRLCAHKWTGKTIKKCWEFGLELWKTRNGLIHGANGTTSQLEKDRVQEIIRTLFHHREEMESQLPVNMFQRGETALLQMEYTSQVGWIEQMRYLYPEEYREIVGKVHREFL